MLPVDTVAVRGIHEVGIESFSSGKTSSERGRPGNEATKAT